MLRPRQIKGVFCEVTKAPISKLDKRSLRWKPSGRAWLLVGCPKGSWKPRAARCTVGTRAHKLLTPARGRCRSGRKIRKG